jgi:hypothetical protein
MAVLICDQCRVSASFNYKSEANIEVTVFECFKSGTVGVSPVLINKNRERPLTIDTAVHTRSFRISLFAAESIQLHLPNQVLR